MRARRLTTFALCLSFLVAACGASHSDRLPGDHSAPVNLRSLRLTANQLDDLASADATFGSELFAAAAGRSNGNIVMSPASIAIALQMAYAGARGRTAAEMAGVLHVPGVDPTEVAAAASQLLAKLRSASKPNGPILSLVNQVWVQDGFPLTTSYQTAMSSGFGAAFRRADFSHDADGARQDINDAVASDTHNRIRDLLAPGTLDSTTRLVLTNAVYLQARWLYEFTKAETAPRPFHLANGTQVTTDTMHQQEGFDYVHRDGYQAIVLPYVGGRLAMTVLIPDGSLKALLAKLRTTGVGAMTAGATYTQLSLYLPRFRFDWSAELSHPLATLGMPTAFTTAADFDGISTAEKLRIAFVQHKAFIALDEQGTEAAAATAVGVFATGAMPNTRKPVVVRADHPFLFAITDTKAGLPLFLGRVSDPRSTVGG